MAEQFSEVEFTSDVGDAVSAALNIDTSLAAFCAHSSLVQIFKILYFQH